MTVIALRRLAASLRAASKLDPPETRANELPSNDEVLLSNNEGRSHVQSAYAPADCLEVVASEVLVEAA